MIFIKFLHFITKLLTLGLFHSNIQSLINEDLTMTDKTTIPLTLTIMNWNQDAANKIAEFNNIDLTGCKSIEEQLHCLSDVLYSSVWNQFVYFVPNPKIGAEDMLELILCDINVGFVATEKSFPAFGIV